MNRTRLICYVALAEELHFHRAAARCHITQPALSQQLKQLEDQLQAKLLYRNQRTVSLTPAGEVFLLEARKILRLMDQAAHLTQQTDLGMVGQLSVGVTAPALYIVFPEIVKLFKEKLPAVDIVVQEMTTAMQEDALRIGTIQIGIVHPPLDDESLSCDLIARTRFRVVLSERNKLASARTLALADLANEHFIIFPRKIGPRLYDQIISLCQEAGFSPEVIIEGSPAQSIIALAAANVGIGLIASELQQFGRPGVVYRDLEGAAPYLTLGIAYHKGDASPAVAVFLEAAREVGKRVV